MRSFFLNHYVRKIGDTRVVVSFLKRGRGIILLFLFLFYFSTKINSISYRGAVLQILF